MIKQYSELKILRKQKLENTINPAIKPLLSLLEQKNKSIEIREGFTNKSNGFFKKDNLTETVVLSCFEFVNILEIDNLYRRGYALALSYSLSDIFGIDSGASATEIDDSVRKRSTSPYGDVPDLIKTEQDWYKKFCKSNHILKIPIEKLIDEVKLFDIGKIDEEHSRFSVNFEEVKKFTEQKDAKIDKLIKLVIKKIPTVNLNKILSTLRTEVVIISTEGSKDKSSGSDIRGSLYLNQALDEKISSKNKLNRSVRFVLLNEVTKGDDPRSFDLQNWGLEIDNKAKKIRSDDEGDKRSFSFVVLKSSMHELYVFGDTLPEKGMIKIPPEVVDGVKRNEATESTLQLLAKALANEETSLQDFINYNLEYLDGIPDESTANYILSSMEKEFLVQKWKISDFPKFDVKPIHITKLGYTEERANIILSEAKNLTNLLKLS